MRARRHYFRAAQGAPRPAYASRRAAGQQQAPASATPRTHARDRPRRNCHLFGCVASCCTTQCRAEGAPRSLIATFSPLSTYAASFGITNTGHFIGLADKTRRSMQEAKKGFALSLRCLHFYRRPPAYPAPRLPTTAFLSFDFCKQAACALARCLHYDLSAATYRQPFTFL